MLPKKYLQRIESFLSKSDFEQTIKGYTDDRVCSFRINTLKSTQEEIESFLYTRGISFEKIPLLPLAYTIEKKDEFVLKGSSLFYEGKIYMQGLASQLPAVLLGVKEGIKVLDITAAPGSKTTQMAALMNNTGTIVACEKHQIRYDKLVHNIQLQGATNIETYKMDAMKLMDELAHENKPPVSPLSGGQNNNTPLTRGDEGGLFDAILLDAPCSAEGRFKIGDERSYGFWTLQNIRDKAVIQTSLLEASIPLLKK